MVNKLQENRKLIIYMCLTVLWVLFIFSFSMQSGEESSQVSGGIVFQLIKILFPQGFAYVEQLEFFIRKAAHFTEYFVLGVLVLQTLSQTSCPKQVIIGILLCIIVASCDETIQLFSGGRSGKIADVVLDSVGAWCGVICRLKVRCRRHV